MCFGSQEKHDQVHLIDRDDLNFELGMAFLSQLTSNEIKRCLFLLVNEKFFVERK